MQQHRWRPAGAEAAWLVGRQYACSCSRHLHIPCSASRLPGPLLDPVCSFQSLATARTLAALYQHPPVPPHHPTAPPAHPCLAARDLKLDNTILDSRDPPRLKLCDFGFAKGWGTNSNMDTMRIGTPEYMGPELISSR
jgi:serine/threonine protein kinase